MVLDINVLVLALLRGSILDMKTWPKVTHYVEDIRVCLCPCHPLLQNLAPQPFIHTKDPEASQEIP